MVMAADSESSSFVVDDELAPEVPAVPPFPPPTDLTDWDAVYAAMRAKAGFVPRYQPPKLKPKPKPKRQFLTRDDIDFRTRAGQAFLQLIDDLSADLNGGPDGENLSTVERALIEAFAGAAVALNNLNIQLLRAGDSVKPAVLAAHAGAVNSMSKLAARLGTRRVKPVMNLDTFLELRRQSRGEPPEGSIE